MRVGFRFVRHYCCNDIGYWLGIPLSPYCLQGAYFPVMYFVTVSFIIQVNKLYRKPKWVVISLKKKST